MPILAAVEAVTVPGDRPQQGPAGCGELSGADITPDLARHGVKATIERTVSADVLAGAAGMAR